MRLRGGCHSIGFQELFVFLCFYPLTGSVGCGIVKALFFHLHLYMSNAFFSHPRIFTFKTECFSFGVCTSSFSYSSDG